MASAPKSTGSISCSGNNSIRANFLMGFFYFFPIISQSLAGNGGTKNTMPTLQGEVLIKSNRKREFLPKLIVSSPS